jgi:hypothetical protein
MNPSKHARSLYFTPRTPWGRLPQNRPAQSQNYLRASQDAPVKRDPSGKDMQGLAGGMADNQFGGSQGQTGGSNDPRWNLPRSQSRDFPLTLYPQAQLNIQPATTPTVVHYDSSQDQEALDRALGKGQNGYEGNAGFSKVGAERGEADVDLGRRFPKNTEETEKFKDPQYKKRYGPDEQKKRDLEEQYGIEHTVAVDPYVFPPRLPPKPIRIATPIMDKFTPRQKTPPPPSTLRPYEQR